MNSESGSGTVHFRKGDGDNTEDDADVVCCWCFYRSENRGGSLVVAATSKGSELVVEASFVLRSSKRTKKN